VALRVNLCKCLWDGSQTISVGGSLLVLVDGSQSVSVCGSLSMVVGGSWSISDTVCEPKSMLVVWISANCSL
jgi:hypothetical protein